MLCLGERQSVRQCLFFPGKPPPSILNFDNRCTGYIQLADDVLKGSLGSFSWVFTCAKVPRSARAVITSGPASRNVFQQACFPFPEKLPLLSAPLVAWNPSKAAFFQDRVLQLLFVVE